MATRTDLLTPVGRVIAGSLYKPNTTDAEGKPLVVKSGPSTGQPRADYYFMLAIPKGAEQHWAQTRWGALVYAEGAKAFPQACQAPTFAWKIKDGDSTIPNRRGKRPVDMEGAKGHWLLSMSSGYAPKISKDNGTVPMLEVDAVRPGDYVQVFGSIAGNDSQTQPGIHLNHSLVNFVGYGERITSGPDAASVGFGQGVVLPPGASLTPPAGAWTPPPAAVAGIPAMPPLPGFLPGIPAPTFPVAPNPAFLSPAPVVAAMPMPPALPMPPVPAAPVARQMTAAANGATYEQLIAGGWNDALLRQHGMML